MTVSMKNPLAILLVLGFLAPLAQAEKKASTPEGEEKRPEDWVDPTVETVDLQGFLSNEPPPRDDTPERGQLVVDGDSLEPVEMAHWDEYVGSVKAPRWGRYRFEVRYSLHRAGLGVQCQVGDQKTKGLLKGCGRAEGGRTQDVGGIYIAQAGEVPVRVLTPPTDLHANFIIHEIRLVPACEGRRPAVAEDGGLTLHARDATTWSTNMRYEPKKEKGCLGFWTEIEDFAEWHFEIAEPRSYQVTVTYGCGGAKNAGSEVEVRVGERTLAFKTEDTGGFQSWREVAVGEIEFPKAGHQRLVVQPRTKVGNAVLDVQKVVLTPIKEAG